jgi:uncharacterized delta-60 repeat protein
MILVIKLFCNNNSALSHKNYTVLFALMLIILVSLCINAAFAQRFVLAKYNPNSSLDTTFSGDGLQGIDFFSSCYDMMESVAIQPNGKIVIGGVGTSNCPYNPTSSAHFILLARINPDTGSYDTSFGGSGKIRTDIAGTKNEYLNSIAIDINGKIVAVGYSTINSNDIRLLVVRYNPDGSLDSSFANTGILNIDVGSSNNERLNSVAIDKATNKIVAGGYYTGVNDKKALVVRLNPDGSFDNFFDGDGLQGTNVGGINEEIKSIAIDKTTGKIVAGGYYTPNINNPQGNEWFLVARYNPNGLLDKSFGGDGLVTGTVLPELCYNRALINSVAITLNNKVVAGGYCYGVISGSFPGVVARYNADGTSDASFSSDSYQAVKGIGTLAVDTELFESVAIDPNGKIVGGGFNDLNDDTRFSLTRYNSNGRVDKTFSSDGASEYVTTNIKNGKADYIQSIAIDSNGKIVAGGFVQD